MNDFDDLEDLERRMRRKLLFDGSSSRGSKFSPEEQAIADKLISKDDIRRLERREANPRHGGARPKRFRPTPVFIHYEYWWINGDQHSLGGWRMARVENGKRTGHRYTSDIETEIIRLKAAGFTVKEIKIEGAPTLFEPKAKHESTRKAVLQQLKGFRK